MLGASLVFESLAEYILLSPGPPINFRFTDYRWELFGVYLMQAASILLLGVGWGLRLAGGGNPESSGRPPRLWMGVVLLAVGVSIATGGELTAAVITLLMLLSPPILFNQIWTVLFPSIALGFGASLVASGWLVGRAR